MKMISISINSAKTLPQAHAELCQMPLWWYWSVEVGVCTYMITTVAFATKAMKELHIHCYKFVYFNKLLGIFINCYKFAHQEKETSGLPQASRRLWAKSFRPP